MPEHARVAVFEDHTTAQNQLRKLLMASGHQIVGFIAATREEAEKLVQLIATGKLKPDVILLDHNLIGITGEVVVHTLTQHEIQVPIIGISRDVPQQESYLNHTAPKGSRCFEYLGETISDL